MTRPPTPIERACGAKWRTNYLSFFRSNLVTPHIIYRAMTMSDQRAEDYVAVMQHVFNTLK